MNQIIADVGVYETRAAVVQNGRIIEMHVERHNQRSLVNNIYTGQIVNRLPGMQTIFVDAGLSKNIFIYQEDLTVPFNDLHEGDFILLQITKDAFGEKGPKGTMRMAIPGRFLIMLPNDNHIGISHKISDHNERSRLENWAQTILNNNNGMIIRTAASEQNLKALTKDWQHLQSVWQHIANESKQSIKKIVYREQSLLPRLLRDTANQNTDRIQINDCEEAQQLKSLCQFTQPDLLAVFQETGSGSSPFSDENLELEWQRLLSSEVQLENGGTLAINATEALTVIDVNSGRYIGSHGFEETALQVNIAAAIEIAHQLRVRDIGGIILIDFIDMKKETNNEKVLETLNRALSVDRQKTVLVGMTQLGLVEMTRKRSRSNLSSLYQTTCPCCHGSGAISSVHWLVYELEKAFRRYQQHSEINEAHVTLHPTRYQQLRTHELDLTTLANVYGLNLNLTLSKSIEIEDYTLSFR
ncbi:Rne/Rng family ribonuclease [Anoxynatronum buryatiense]|uniref:RNAse G n=1 Tax=Anoxynatronum buryatiense TaxID=489973 RepID=A0AA45WUT1_9CLOT|nr:Rne/Rng family ribonuclease [Anoxynatronum buryatiense]SMP49628.1 RNAse G [Anoxynatronum buryatiense]